MLANKIMGATSAAPDVNYIEDVFSTYLYTGNSSTQTITNGIDLAGEGGLVWFKARSFGNGPALIDTARGGTQVLATNSTGGQSNFSPQGISAFNANGFTFGTTTTNLNATDTTYASWTFRKQPKFFDIVTYTGDGVQPRAIAHSLGSTPGCVIVKNTSAGGGWYVYHVGSNAPGYTAAESYLLLNSTNAVTDNAAIWGNTAPSGTTFTVSTQLNQAGNTYVAYLFAHDAGGFGLSGNENVVSCGSFTTNGSGVGSANLNFEPQWVLYKNSNNTEPWRLMDSMRGMPDLSSNLTTSNTTLFPNTSGAESGYDRFWATSTGVHIANGAANSPIIYIAIRRGPMKVPTDGTKVYNAVARDGTGAVAQITGVGFPPDLVIPKPRNNLGSTATFDRLRGALRALTTNSTGAEFNAPNSLTSFNMDGVSVSSDIEGLINTAFSYTYINWCFRRAPSFFDEVCYTGTGNPLTLNHNLGVAPELILYKSRSNAQYWLAQSSALASVTDSYLLPNYDSAAGNIGGLWRTPSATTFGIALSGNVTGANVSSQTYVAYLFATCAGVSKVFSFTGNGSSQTIDCGFTAGARFILIKCTSTTGDWYVWDTARGIVANSDPHLSLNTTAAEVTTDDTIDPASSGFIVNQVAATNVNVNGATYIGLAIS